jgi:glyoxylase-like metal-dependent hydrolase (beta-lactamase superfamily II)
MFKLPAVPEHTPECTLQVMNAGFCRARKSHILQGAGSGETWLPALFYLIHHPEHGPILFDTGYSTRFFEVTARFPYSVMRKVTPVRIEGQDNAVRQLRGMGIAPQDIQTVILSHLHVDHVGGIHPFVNATIYVDEQEWAYGKQSALKLLRKGYIKPLYASIKPSSLRLLHFNKEGTAYGPFRKTIDIFQDGSVILIPLPGHTVGQCGLLLNISNAERYFLIADSVFVKDNYRRERAGSLLSRLVHHSPRQYKRQFSVLRQVEEANPDLVLIPSHDPDAYAQWVSNKQSPQA